MTKGSLFIISGPSGTGKGTVCKELIKHDNIYLSISATTRDIRTGEEDGVTYFFVSEKEFSDMVDNGMMLECAEYNGHRYGTPKLAVENMLAEGKNVILEIEAQGALKVKEKMPEAVMIFLVPPSIEVLRHRLKTRGREDEAEIERRIKVAKWEFSQCPKYNYVLVNDTLEACVNDTLEIIEATNQRQKMIEKLINEI